ncbi:MAG TPA: hypothetical protein VFR86_07310 [Burkholderiaceae bacterium]|nr:hypothetical protein [Burkholderiaceae bacterium]
MKHGFWLRMAVCSALALTAATAWLGYQQPEFVVWLNSAVLLCT